MNVWECRFECLHSYFSSIFGSKSSIKRIKSRIDVIRRKRKATEKFLKKDIADLLGNGLDVNAYGRVCILFFSF